ncbi:MAG: hypothetical protein KF744_00075 [Taibaiella sp.]|nr:hypothetical protein [Taibaiella sp.]
MIRSIFLILALCCVGVNASYGQLLRKYPVGKSGCTVRMFCDPGSFELSMSPDSSAVYTGECKRDSVIYDVICVRMKDRIDSLGDAEAILLQYLDYLKNSFGVSESAGYGKGHYLKGKEKSTRGLLDYWRDKDGMNIKVKGWTDGRYISVHLVISALPIKEEQAELFLNGIEFPAEARK